MSHLSHAALIFQPYHQKGGNVNMGILLNHRTQSLCFKNKDLLQYPTMETTLFQVT